MQYVNLGSSGLKVSRICFGTAAIGSPAWQKWAIGEAEARPVFKKALDLGITYFDTADRYSTGLSEEITGTLLKELAPRHQIVLSTKVCGRMGDGPNDEGLSRKHIMESVDASLRRLKTDYIDLYVIHRFDAETPIEETMDALNDVVRAGKARYLGASSMAAFQFAKMRFAAERNGWANFVSMQNLYNLLYREEEREMSPFCVEEGVALTPWSPPGPRLFRQSTGQGRSLPRPDRQEGPGTVSPGPRFRHRRAGRPGRRQAWRQADQVALTWMLAKPGIAAPVVGAIKERYVEDAVAALDIRLDAED